MFQSGRSLPTPALSAPLFIGEFTVLGAEFIVQARPLASETSPQKEPKRLCLSTFEDLPYPTASEHLSPG